jgi:hypothetical protein
VVLFKKLMPDADPRLFLKTRLADDTAEDDMFDKGEDEDVDVDAI